MMTMDEVFDFLKKNPDKWFTTCELARGIGRTHSAISGLFKLSYNKPKEIRIKKVFIGKRRNVRPRYAYHKE